MVVLARLFHDPIQQILRETVAPRFFARPLDRARQAIKIARAPAE